jgi:flagellar basal body-associated protein FliL
MKNHLRKIVIGLIAVTVVAGAFVIYTYFVDAQPIQMPQSNQHEPTLADPVFTSNQQIAGNQIGGVDDA